MRSEQKGGPGQAGARAGPQSGRPPTPHLGLSGLRPLAAPFVPTISPLPPISVAPLRPTRASRALSTPCSRSHHLGCRICRLPLALLGLTALVPVLPHAPKTPGLLSRDPEFPSRAVGECAGAAGPGAGLLRTEQPPHLPGDGRAGGLGRSPPFGPRQSPGAEAKRGSRGAGRGGRRQRAGEWPRRRRGLSSRRRGAGRPRKQRTHQPPGADCLPARWLWRALP